MSYLVLWFVEVKDEREEAKAEAAMHQSGTPFYSTRLPEGMEHCKTLEDVEITLENK